MSLGQAVRSVFSKYVVFEGRARRSELWMFVLFNFLVGTALLIIASLLLAIPVSRSGRSEEEIISSILSEMYVLYGVSGLYSLAVFLPGLAVSARRLHDIGKSGGLILLALIPFGAIVLLVWFCTDSQPGTNAYGPNPKENPGFSGEIPPNGRAYIPDPYVPGTIPASKPLSVNQVMRPRVSVPDLRLKANIGQGSLILGRNADCGLVFPAGTPGISGRHCAVTWDPNTSEFIVKDLNSTYGTYLQNGRRLDPTQVYRLRQGTSIYLGGERNKEVRLEIA